MAGSGRAGALAGVAHVRIDPEIEPGGALDPTGAGAEPLRALGWRAAPEVQPSVTRVIDLSADEAALWSDLRKKWRQYVNRARTLGVTVSEVDADADPTAFPTFHRVMTETSRRTGTLIRTEAAYRDIWDAFRPDGVRLLFARDGGGDVQAVLLLVRCGTRVVEPYGGMTAAGAEDRANYLLKWEAIRRSREAGATSYDLWGLVHPGIRQFKEGFGGREVRLIGAWDLPLSRIGSGLYRFAEARRRPPKTPVLGPPGGRRRGRGAVTIHEATPEELHDWDSRTVEVPGGNVYQSRAWGEQRARIGWRPRYLASTTAIACCRSNVRGGSSAGRGRTSRAARSRPVSPSERTAERLAAAAGYLADRGVDVVASDSEIPAASGYGPLIRAAGFRPIEEVQPSRHRVALALEPGVAEEAVFRGFATSVRQRVRHAERSGLRAVRWDARSADDPGPGFEAPPPAESPAPGDRGVAAAPGLRSVLRPARRDGRPTGVRARARGRASSTGRAPGWPRDTSSTSRSAAPTTSFSAGRPSTATAAG